MKTPSLFASLSALLVIAALGVYFGGRPATARQNSDLAGNKLVRPSRPSARPADQSRIHTQHDADPTSTVQAAAIAEPAPASLTAAYPEITTQVNDWKKFNREAKTITVAPFKGMPLHFTRVRVKDEGKYVTWIGTDPEIPSSSLIAVATPSGSYSSVMILPGTDQFSFYTEPNGTTTMAETNPGAENCAIGVQSKRVAEATPLTPALFKAQYTAGAEIAAKAGFGYDANGADIPPVAGPVLGVAATNVDVLFLYDAESLGANNRNWRILRTDPNTGIAGPPPADMVAFIDALSKTYIETGNVFLTNSLVTNFQWRYLGALQVPAYTRPTASTFVDSNGVSHAVSKLESDLNAMAPGGAINAFVSMARFDFGADQIVLWRGDEFADASGVAFSIKQAPETRGRALAVVLEGVSVKTVIHEMGHTFGLQHERGEFGGLNGAKDGDGFIAYAKTFVFTVPIFGDQVAGTVMNAGAGAVIPFFSNPNVTIHVTSALAQGASVSVGGVFVRGGNPGVGDWGTQALGLPAGDPKAAFNAKVLTDNALAMAALVDEITMPAITAQPANTTANTGGSLSISVAATGGGLNFQWSKDGSPINGATATTFSKTASSTDAGNYSVVVSNRAGTVTSSAATVTISSVVTPPPSGGGSGGSSGGGGGGAPSEWFLGALAALIAARRLRQKPDSTCMPPPSMFRNGEQSPLRLI